MHAPKKILELEKNIIHKKHPSFHGGDTIRVHARIREGTKERIQVVEGVTIRFSGKGATRTFTVRKISKGIGVELIYPLYSPHIAKIEVVSRGKVRQGRLYYLRKLAGRAAKLKSREVRKNKSNSKKIEAKQSNTTANGKATESASQTTNLDLEKKAETTE